MCDDGDTPSHDSDVGLASSVLVMLRVWRERARFRGELAARSEHELQDMGMYWSSISSEVNKPFWRA